MTFEPEPGLRLHLGKDEVIEFLPLEASGPASVFVYAESGKEGTVYKVLKNQEQYALKVFYPEYRDKRLLENTEKLSRFKDLEGFRVAERNLIEPEEYPNLIRIYPELSYSVLMPWIQGTVWGNIMLEPDPSMQPEHYLQIANTLIRVVNNLESQGLAHCDLSNNNFIIANGFSNVQLIDVEDMYAPDMPRPIPDISYGTTGYRTRWIAESGLWGPESDRFAIAILCSEILAWQYEEIRKNKSGNVSFFDEDEIGEDSNRYKLMTRYLDDQSKDLPMLFEKAWFAKEFTQCPPVSEWFEAVRRIGLQTIPEPETSLPADEESQPATIILGSVEPTPDEMDAHPFPEMEFLPVEEDPSQSETVVASTIDDVTITSKEVEEPEIPPFQDTMSSEDDQTPSETVTSEGSDTSVSSGVPARMNISLEILDFGTVGKPENTQQFTISNSGGSTLNVSIRSEEWIDISQNEFVLTPGENQRITASINTKYPHPKTGREFRTAIALDIDSNAGNEVIGARFVISKPPFHESKWRRTLLGTVIGMIFSFIVAFLISSSYSDELSYIVIPAILFLFGLSGYTLYPRKASLFFSIAGFVLAEIPALLLITAFYELQENAIAILGLAAGLGVLGGAFASKILFGRNRSSQADK